MRLLVQIALALGLFLTPAAAQEGFAPNVEMSTLGADAPVDPIQYADGRIGSLKDFRGDVALVVLWQVNCPYCHEEMPKLDRLAGAMAAEGVRVVALGLDQDMGMIRGWLDRKGYSNIEPIMDVDKFNGSVLSIEHFGRLSIATPTSFIVDKNGIVVAKIWGLVDWDGDTARSYLRGLAAG